MFRLWLGQRLGSGGWTLRSGGFIKRILKEALMDRILREMYGIWRLRSGGWMLESGGWILRSGSFIKKILKEAPMDRILKEMYGFWRLRSGAWISDLEALYKDSLWKAGFP